MDFNFSEAYAAICCKWQKTYNILIAQGQYMTFILKLF